MKIKINTEKITLLSIQLGMDHETLSKKAKIDSATIHRVFKFKNATPKVLKKIADCLKCRVLDLLEK